ncbi:MAG: hypothetical protein C4589_09480 [Peptococcaceae bacterium]|nr:MAG: hypothetical protein C4589_09480 [Peptococcaceae bacterium]
MTLHELFEYPYFMLLPMRQKLIAVGLFALAEGGTGIADPVFLKNKILTVEADELRTAEIEADLEAIQKALPVEVFEEDEDRFYRWLA